MNALSVGDLVKARFNKWEDMKENQIRFYNFKNLGLVDRDLAGILKEVDRREENQEVNELKISLDENVLGWKGCLYLNKVRITYLTSIYLHGNRIGDEGCQQLSKGNWPLIRALGVERCEIRQKGCMNLTKANWSNLQYIYISENKINRKGYICLRRRFKLCAISCDPEYTHR